MFNEDEDTLEAPNYKGKKAQKKRPDYKKRNEIKPPKKISERYLYNSGLAYLQRFPASSYHFKSVMMRKIDKSCRHHVEQNTEQCEKWLDELILKFQELTLLDDKAYLKGMMTSYRRRGLSSMQIKLKLSQKGYSTEDIQNELSQYDAQEYQTEYEGDLYAALIFARKKRLGPFDIENKKPFEKALASMARGGYSFEVAKKTLEISPDDLEERLKFI